MRTVDRVRVRAPLAHVFQIVADVERWPEFLAHYRWVRILERNEHGCLVEMAAWRPFGPLRYPTWWVSRMERDDARRAVRYRHVRGITRGMDVEWTVRAQDGDVEIMIIHEWSGPKWPLVGRLAARLVIGPVFIHGIASRTLAGVKRRAEIST